MVSRGPGKESDWQKWARRCTGVLMMAVGVWTIISGQYHSRSGEAIQDSGRVWLVGILTILAGAFLATAGYWLRRKE